MSPAIDDLPEAEREAHEAVSHAVNGIVAGGQYEPYAVALALIASGAALLSSARGGETAIAILRGAAEAISEARERSTE